MKKFLKILGFIIGFIVLLIAGVAAWVSFTGLPTYDVKELTVQLPTDSASLQIGKNIASEFCAHCHMGEDNKLSGHLFSRATDAFGEIWTGNITRHPVLGIGRYTDGELAYLLRTGVKRDGLMAGPFMSSLTMSDQDQAAVIAFLRSENELTAPSDIAHPAPKYSFLAKALIKFGAFKPLPYDGKPVVTPPPSEPVAFGKYLVVGRYECYGCHSKSFETINPQIPEKSEGYLGGGNQIQGKDFSIVISKNITMNKELGLGNWTAEQFANAVRTGIKPDKTAMAPHMPRFTNMSDEDANAIWAYLQTVPVLGDPLEASN